MVETCALLCRALKVMRLWGSSYAWQASKCLCQESLTIVIWGREEDALSCLCGNTHGNE